MADENSSDSEYDEKVSKKVKKIIERSHKEALDYWILVQKLKITSDQKKSNKKSKIKPFACEICGVGCSTSSNLKRHINSIHSEFIEPEEKQNLQISNAQRETQDAFQCEVCSSEFPYESQLKRHFVVHTEELSFACESCDVYFGTSYHFDEHIRKKHSDFSEPIETEKKHLQTNHVVLVESIEQNISTNDENHIASIHIQLQTFGCDYCEETFELENDKSDHVNTNHLKDYQTLLALADIFNKENNEKEARKKLFLLGRKMNQSTEEMQKIINM